MNEVIARALFGEGGLLKVRALLAFALTGIVGYMYTQELTIPDVLETAWIMTLTFYFSTRAVEGVKAFVFKKNTSEEKVKPPVDGAEDIS